MLQVKVAREKRKIFLKELLRQAVLALNGLKQPHCPQSILKRGEKYFQGRVHPIYLCGSPLHSRLLNRL